MDGNGRNNNRNYNLLNPINLKRSLKIFVEERRKKKIKTNHRLETARSAIIVHFRTYQSLLFELFFFIQILLFYNLFLIVFKDKIASRLLTSCNEVIIVQCQCSVNEWQIALNVGENAWKFATVKIRERRW